MRDFLIFDAPLDERALYAEFSAIAAQLNYGAFLSFSGIIRDEDGISGLSFDIHDALLKSWFTSWQERTKALDMQLFFAHSRGDVLIGECSYFAGIASKQRKKALEIYPLFIEDFKQNAPIWKYDLKGGERIYAQARSYKLPHAGLFS